MTNREFYEYVAQNIDNDEYKAFAMDAIAKIDATNAKRAEKNAVKTAANLELAKAMVATLTDEPITASDLAKKFEVSPQKVASVLSRSGLAFNKVKIKDGKATRVGYTA